jgi:Flp pilus assembly protein TadD
MGRRRKKNPAATGSLARLESRRPARAAGDVSGGKTIRPRDWLLAIALVAAVFLAYQPVWQGGFIWDDDTHLLNNPVLTPGGIFRTWVPGSYVNYWPLTFTVYWVEYQLWGLAPAGFHLANIALHALSAILIWRVLALLRVPGALLAAALFALHPVNVESVAWVTQLKNTLSLALTLVSVLLYLLSERRGGRSGFEAPIANPVGRSRRPAGTFGGATDPAAQSPARQAGPTWLFWAAVAVFALATLAKGMTLTLPVVLLACAWWQRGRIQGRDLWRVAPFLLIAAAMVVMEVLQQHAVAAQAVVRSDGLLSRTAVAGCAVWFYLWKLVWPADLVFVYPRWNLNAMGALWFVPGLLLAAVVALAWRWRRTWGRPVLMLTVCYVALLLPVLGFVDIYFMEFSLVADHWQYAATIVPCAAFAGLVSRQWSVVSRGQRTTDNGQRASDVHPSSFILHPLSLAGYAMCVALLATLAALTWRQSSMYADVERLYRTTLDRNPDCWMIRNNLGVVLVRRGQIDEAVGQYRQALELKPDYADAYNNLGAALARQRRIDEAIGQYQQALQLKPDYAEAHNNLGSALVQRGRIDEAIGHLHRALKVNPDYTEAHYNLGLALAGQGRIDEAIGQYRTALALARQQHKTALAEELRSRLRRYEAETPDRPPQPPIGQAPRS